MKKIFLLVLTAAILLHLSACSDTEIDDNNRSANCVEKIQITYPIFTADSIYNQDRKFWKFKTPESGFYYNYAYNDMGEKDQFKYDPATGELKTSADSWYLFKTSDGEIYICSNYYVGCPKNKDDLCGDWEFGNGRIPVTVKSDGIFTLTDIYGNKGTGTYKNINNGRFSISVNFCTGKKAKGTMLYASDGRAYCTPYKIEKTNTVENNWLGADNDGKQDSIEKIQISYPTFIANSLYKENNNRLKFMSETGGLFYNIRTGEQHNFKYNPATGELETPAESWYLFKTSDNKTYICSKYYVGHPENKYDFYSKWLFGNGRLPVDIKPDGTFRGTNIDGSIGVGTYKYINNGKFSLSLTFKNGKKEHKMDGIMMYTSDDRGFWLPYILEQIPLEHKMN